jgi:hypothetical protein
MWVLLIQGKYSHIYSHSFKQLLIFNHSIPYHHHQHSCWIYIHPHSLTLTLSSPCTFPPLLLHVHMLSFPPSPSPSLVYSFAYGRSFIHSKLLANMARSFFRLSLYLSQIICIGSLVCCFSFYISCPYPLALHSKYFQFI